MPSLHHLALRTGDLPRLVEFYQRVLGLTVIREQPAYSAWLRAGEAVLMLEVRGAAEPPVPAGSMELVAFAVSEAEREAVRARVAVEHETAYTTYFRDPDGRRVAVSTYAFGG